MKRPATQQSSTFLEQKNFKQNILVLLSVAVALLAGCGYYWYQNVLTNPQRILSDMLDKSLQTTSVDRKVSQQDAQGKIEETVHLSFTPTTALNSTTKLQQTSQLGTTEVTTEKLGTQDVDYIRYASINVNGKSKNDNDVVGSWASRKGNPQTGESTSFLNDALFVAVPFGNLNFDQRREVKDEIAKVNLYKYQSSKIEYVNGRPTMSYNIDLDPQALVQVLSKYVEVTRVGSGEQLDPVAYRGAGKIPVVLQVDLFSRHVKNVEFASSGRSENYYAYNLVRSVEPPHKTISVEELQARLQKLEQQQ